MYSARAPLVALSLAVLAVAAHAGIQRKASTTPGARPVPTSSTSWVLWVPGYETVALGSGTHYWACGVKPQSSSKITAVRSAWLVTADGQPLLGTTSFLPNATTTTDFDLKAGIGFSGLLASFQGPLGAGIEVTLCIEVDTSPASRNEMCQEVAGLGIATDAADSTGRLRATAYQLFGSHPCPPRDPQNLTLPDGFAEQEGNSEAWSGWDLWSLTDSSAYLPARTMYSYRASVFPWDASQPRTLTGLMTRQDMGRVATFSPHKKDMALLVSTDGFDPARPSFRWLPDTTHGKNRTVVMQRRTIDFTAPPRTKAPADFHVNFPFDVPFQVPANASNLILDIRSYTASAGGFVHHWRPDAHAIDSPLSRGSTRLMGVQCPTTPTMTIGNSVSWSGGDLSVYVDTWVAKTPVILWIGAPLPIPFPVPDTGGLCEVTVQGIVFLVGTTEDAPRGRAEFFLGRVPDLQPGTRLGYEFAVWKPGYPWLGSLGVTQGGSYTFGEGWTDPLVEYGSVAAYGGFLIGNNPDWTSLAGFLRSAAVIWKVK